MRGLRIYFRNNTRRIYEYTHSFYFKFLLRESIHQISFTGNLYFASDYDIHYFGPREQSILLIEIVSNALNSSGV